MGFYKSVASHKEGDLLRMEEGGPVYVWYEEHWQPLPHIYQEIYATLDNTQLPKNIGNISRILRMMLGIEIRDSNRYLDKEKDNGILQNNSN